MSKNSKIGWTHHTFNPWWGCQRVSPGCENCYAEELDARFHQDPHWGPKAPRKAMSEKYWNDPLRWQRQAAKAMTRYRVFCASMADVFEDRDDLSDRRHRLFRLIQATQNLDWLLLTKRPENIMRLSEPAYRGHDPEVHTWPANIWLGTTVEGQAYTHRIDTLRAVPAAIRFLSIEPMLGPIKLPSLDGIDWVIIGGESGTKARPFPVDDARRLVRDIRFDAPHVKLFFKQLGARPTGTYGHRLPIVSNHGADLVDIPPDLQYREFPR